MRRKRKQKTRRPSRRQSLFLRMMAGFIAAVSLFIALDHEVRPVILTMAGYQVRVSGLLAINEAVLEQMEQYPYKDELVILHRDAAGDVTAIETNTAALNKLKAQLTGAVGQKLAQIERSRIEIPLGTLLGWQIFAGKGPEVPFHVVPASSVESSLRSSTDSAGINQIHHQIFITFTVEMSAIIPGYTADVTVENEICIADTLIMGHVPEFYAGTNG